MNNKVHTILPSKELEKTILSLAKLKYEVGNISTALATDLEYDILANLRTLHSYLKETEQ